MVHVLWRRQLPDRRAGQVTRQADSDGWLERRGELSVRNIVGTFQTPSRFAPWRCMRSDT
jgi:hypothetical protein